MKNQKTFETTTQVMLTFFLVQPAGCKAFMATCRPPAGPAFVLIGVVRKDKRSRIRPVRCVTNWLPAETSSCNSQVMSLEKMATKMAQTHCEMMDFFGNIELGKWATWPPGPQERTTIRQPCLSHHFKKSSHLLLKSSDWWDSFHFFRTTSYCYIAHNR